jgi:selT/selW/selH-like putative selenoprotein
LAASLDSAFGEKTEITPGKSGQFDVIVNGKLVFSKSSTGRFPVDGEVEEIFAALKEGREPKPVEVKKPEGFVGRMLGKLRN